MRRLLLVALTLMCACTTSGQLQRRPHLSNQDVRCLGREPAQARDGLGLFDRSTANVAVELRDQRDGRRLERQPVLLEFVPGSEDLDEYASKFRPGSVFELR